MKTIKRRRKENKTDYLKKLKMLKSGKPRLVVRKTNRYVILQYVESNEAQDRVVLGLTSKILLKHGWVESKKGSLKSLAAAYLAGFAMGKKIVKKKLETPIIDLGMVRNVHKSRIYGVVKGLVEAGVKIKHNAKVFPEDEKLKDIEGIEIEKIKSGIEKND